MSPVLQMQASSHPSSFHHDAPVPVKEQEAVHEREIEWVKVLLIDDQPVVAESMRRSLADQPDIELYYCRDPKQAISQAIEIKPTVILQDLVMPNVDGLVMVKFFRANPATRSIPIVMLSNHDKSMVKAEAFSLGVNDYLVKMPDAIELTARLRYHSTAYTNSIERHKASRYNQELERRVAERTEELETALTNLKKAQSQLIQEEKMVSLGQLVAGVAHEINNPINFISGNLQPAEQYAQDLLHLIEVYQEEFPQSTERLQAEMDAIDLDFLTEDFTKLLHSLKIGADRIQEIVLSLRNFSRLDEDGMKVTNICDGIDSTLLILGSKLHGVEMIHTYNDCPFVECFPGQLNQVFMNILANAADALEEKANLGKQEENSTKSPYQPEIRIHSQTIDDRWVQITITDNGPGIPEEVCDRLFEPFVTTKPIGKGTGLGLSISHQIIVEKHGGTIEVSSTPGQGTTFTIKIPLKSEC